MNCSCGPHAWVLVGDGSPNSDVVVETRRSQALAGTTVSTSRHSIGGSQRYVLGCESIRENSGGFAPGHCSISQTFRITSASVNRTQPATQAPAASGGPGYRPGSGKKRLPWRHPNDADSDGFLTEKDVSLGGMAWDDFKDPRIKALNPGFQATLVKEKKLRKSCRSLREYMECQYNCMLESSVKNAVPTMCDRNCVCEDCAEAIPEVFNGIKSLECPAGHRNPSSY